MLQPQRRSAAEEQRVAHFHADRADHAAVDRRADAEETRNCAVAIRPLGKDIAAASVVRVQAIADGSEAAAVAWNVQPWNSPWRARSCTRAPSAAACFQTKLMFSKRTPSASTINPAGGTSSVGPAPNAPRTHCPGRSGKAAASRGLSASSTMSGGPAAPGCVGWHWHLASALREHWRDASATRRVPALDASETSPHPVPLPEGEGDRSGATRQFAKVLFHVAATAARRWPRRRSGRWRRGPFALRFAASSAGSPAGRPRRRWEVPAAPAAARQVSARGATSGQAAGPMRPSIPAGEADRAGRRRRCRRQFGRRFRGQSPHVVDRRRLHRPQLRQPVAADQGRPPAEQVLPDASAGEDVAGAVGGRAGGDPLRGGSHRPPAASRPGRTFAVGGSAASRGGASRRGRRRRATRFCAAMSPWHRPLASSEANAATMVRAIPNTASGGMRP